MPQGKRGSHDGGDSAPAVARAGAPAGADMAGADPAAARTGFGLAPREQLVVPAAAEANPAPAPPPAYQEDDRRWFAANPGRRHRVRPFDPAEAPPGHPVPARPPGWRNFTVVRQVKPGHRIRLVFAAEGEPATGEHAAARLFDICLRSLGGNPG